ncbi:MAG TPA: TraR/DksA family transcriptional regulator, partial [Usitatibacter sp.]|nr:TraR/DksA family transcriptional regulator [Usitatibacter sp.]
MFHLNQAQRETLRTRLSERARVLRAEIAEALHASATPAQLGLPDRRAEPGDEPVTDLESGIELAGVERDAAELNAVMEALARIDAGHYGKCADCGAPIAYERLLAQPQAARCIRCETERDRLRARPSLPAL